LIDELIISEHGANELNSKRNNYESDPVSAHTGCTANVVLITP